MQGALNVHVVLCMSAHPDVLEVPTRLLDVDTSVKRHPAPSEEPVRVVDKDVMHRLFSSGHLGYCRKGLKMKAFPVETAIQINTLKK